MYICGVNGSKYIKMETTIANKIKEKRGSLYKQAVEMFGVTYKYVIQIATDPNRGQRGKGKLVKDWLNEQLNAENK